VDFFLLQRLVGLSLDQHSFSMGEVTRSITGEEFATAFWQYQRCQKCIENDRGYVEKT
jgi:hypothetical protein